LKDIAGFHSLKNERPGGRAEIIRAFDRFSTHLSAEIFIIANAFDVIVFPAHSLFKDFSTSKNAR